MHIFSMTCKAESVLDLFGDPEERQRAVGWFKDHAVTKLYIESYRHGRLVPEERLRIVRDDFRAAGFDVGGCITPTNLGQGGDRPLVGCYTDPDVLDHLQMIVERTARCFDFFIIDDFLFTDCECDACTALRANRTRADFRCDLMTRIGRERIIIPARTVNPRVRVILKYPLWYEQYRERGYDVPRQTEVYDMVWIGTETRDPGSPEAGRRPQSAASWIQGWMNDMAGEKCGGGWYDPIDTSPDTFVEQARQTILGGARESLLHCYDYLGTDTPGVAIHGKDLEIKHGRADAAAFRREMGLLGELAVLLEGMERYGVLVPCYPGESLRKHGGYYLPGFTGMLGIPMRPAASLKGGGPAFLGMQALGMDGLAGFISDAYRSGTPLVITAALRDALAETGAALPAALVTADTYGPDGICHVTENLLLLRCPADLWDLTALPAKTLDDIRNRLLAPHGMELSAPGRVSLHLYRSGPAFCEVMENFNDVPVRIRLRYTGGRAAGRSLRLVLPEPGSAPVQHDGSGTYDLSLAPRSLLVLAAEGGSCTGTGSGG